MVVLLAVLIIIIAVIITVAIIGLIMPWLGFVYEYYLDWVIDKQDEIIAKRNGEKE